jgi:hypothetical protein
MEFDLHPAITLQTGTFNAVIAPEEAILAGINDNRVLQRFLFLYVSGNYSRLLTGINRRSVNIEVRRAFTAFQLLQILRELYHTILFVEHDPSLYDGAEELADQVGHALKEAGERALVVLYAPRPDPSVEKMTRFATRVFYLAPGAGPGAGRGIPHRSRIRYPGGPPREQTTLEGYQNGA